MQIWTIEEAQMAVEQVKIWIRESSGHPQHIQDSKRFVHTPASSSDKAVDALVLVLKRACIML